MATINEAGSLSRWNPVLNDGKTKAERDISGEYEYSPEAGCPTRYAGGNPRGNITPGSTTRTPSSSPRSVFKKPVR